MRSRGTDPRRPIDLGWLFMLPGVVLIAAGVLIAAEDDLYAARYRRDEAIAIERRHADRVERYRVYLRALERQDPTVVRSLVVSQLNAAPTDLVEARIPGVPVYDSTEVFSSLEPPPAQPPERVRVDSVLARWATDNSSRMWLLASGALCVFVGLLPPANRRAGALAVLDEEGEAGVEADECPGVPDEAEVWEGVVDGIEDDAPDDDAEDLEEECSEDREASDEEFAELESEEGEAEDLEEDGAEEEEGDEDDLLDSEEEEQDEPEHAYDGFEEVENASDDPDAEDDESGDEADEEDDPSPTGETAGPPRSLFDTLRDRDE